MAFIAEETVQKIKDAIDIVSLVGEYVELKRAGANYKGLCPFHSEKTPSFIVSEQRGTFHCFGCHEGGDAISFIMKLENLDYPDALRFLAEKYNIPVQEGHADKEKQKRLQKLYAINRDAMLFYYKNLLTNGVPQQYLMQRQMKPEIINKFYLGYAEAHGDSLYQHLKEKGHAVEDMLHLGLISQSNRGTGYYDRFRNRLMFPIISNKNKIIGFGGRIIGTGEPKYLNSPESDIFHKRENIYGIQIIQKQNIRERILLVEGYMDVIGLHQHGVTYGVASLGTALTADQAKLISRYGKQVYICYDGDKAGINAAKKAIQIFEDQHITPKLITLPDEMDPDDFAKAYGKEAFEKEMDNAQEPLDFELSHLIKQFDLSNLSGRKDFLLAVTSFLAEIDRDLVRDLYVERVSKLADVSLESVQNDVKNMRKDPAFLEKREKERKLREQMAKREANRDRGFGQKSRSGSYRADASGQRPASQATVSGEPWRGPEEVPSGVYNDMDYENGYTNAPDDAAFAPANERNVHQAGKVGTNVSKSKAEQARLAFEVLRLSLASHSAHDELADIAEQTLTTEALQKAYERVKALREKGETPTARRLQETLVGDAYADLLERLYAQEQKAGHVDEQDEAAYLRMAKELKVRIARNEKHLRREEVMQLLQEPDDALESLGLQRMDLVRELQQLDHSLKARGGTKR